MRFALCLGLMVGLFASMSHAQTAHVVKVATFSGNGEGDSTPQSSFSTDVPEITVKARVHDVGPGDKVTAVWVAEKVEGVPANFQITSYTEPLSEPCVVEFHLTEPTMGWPTGTYRVDLNYDGRLEISERFLVH